MKTATVKSHRLLAICTSILLATTTLALAADDGGEPPLTPTSRKRLATYDSFFEGIKALGAQNLKIDRAVRTFIRENFKEGTPTLENLGEFWSRLEEAKTKHGLSSDAVLRIDKSLNDWKTYITAPTSIAAPTLGSAVSSDSTITPLSLTPAAGGAGTYHRRALRDITNTTADRDTIDPVLLRAIKSIAESRRGRIPLTLRVPLPPPRLEDVSTDDSSAHPSGTMAVAAAVASAPVDDLPSIQDLLTHLNSHIIGEEKAMETLVVGVHAHFKTLEVNEGLAGEGSEERVDKENILLCGPTGCGKTASVRAFAKKLNRPLFEGDASSLTRTGYVGESVASLIEGLINEAKNMVTDEVHGSPQYFKKVLELVHKGIIFVDEIDKIAAKKSGSERDIAGSDVQAELLKLSEGKKITVIIKNGPFSPEVYEIDTSKILFIGGGAFTGLSKKDDGVYAPDDFVDAGFKPELLGRFGHMIFLEGMTQEKFEKILTSPAASPIRQSLLLLERGYDIHVNFDAEAMKLIAERAYERSTGVRGLASIVKAALRPLIAQSEAKRSQTILIDRAYIERSIPKVVRVKKDDKPPLGTHERFMLDHPEPPAGMFM